MRHRTLLIDADIFAYLASAAGQQVVDWEGDGNKTVYAPDLERAIHRADSEIDELLERLDAHDAVLCLSCASADGWRRAIYPPYKSQRGAKPEHLPAVKQHLRENYKVYEKPQLEADDIMGILSTHPSIIKGQKVIVSTDKDMKTIPGWLFNPSKDKKPKLIAEHEADYWHAYQTICGDSADHYPGIPRVGPKGAEKILDGKWQWSDVWDAYAERGIGYEDALLQARIARICRHTDYNFKTKEVVLWTPAQ